MDLADFRHLLLELEVDKKKRPGMSKPEPRAACERFYAAILDSNLPIAAVYTSGALSIHALVKLDAKTPEEWRERRDTVKQYCCEMPGFDPKTLSLSRLSRLPGAVRGDFLQALLNWDIGAKSWHEFEVSLVFESVIRPDEQTADGQKHNWPEIEGSAAMELHLRIGQVRCVSNDWYVQKSGIWLPTDRDFYRPIALAVLPDDWRTQARSVEVLKRLEGEQQVTRDQFCGAAKFDKGGAVLVAVANGTLRISPDKAELLPTDPANGFTAALPVAWDDEAGIQLFYEVLEAALPDPCDRELLLDVLATALIPDCRHEAALVLQGEAGTGKSTVIAPVTEIFGAACSSLSMADLCHPSGYKLAMLNHKLINLATELNTLEMDDSGLFKQLVSGERFTARPIYGRPFDMRSTATLVFLANSLPRFKHGTDAEVRRLRFVKFSRKVEKPDLTLKDRVALEAPGVFAELVRRAQELLGGRPLSEPGEFGRETARRFSVSNDPVGQFVARCCKLGSDLQCEKAHVYDAFIQFREQYGISDKFDESAFFRTLYDRFHGVKQQHKRFEAGRRRVLIGIDLASNE